MLVLDPMRGDHPAGAVLDGVRVRGRGVGDAQGDLLNAVAVAALVVADLVLARERARDHEPDASLLQHVRDAIAAAGLEPHVRGLREAERARRGRRRPGRRSPRIARGDRCREPAFDRRPGDLQGAESAVQWPFPVMFLRFERRRNVISLRVRAPSPRHGRRRPNNRFAAARGRAALVQGHRPARAPLGAGGQAARGPAGARRRDPRVHRHRRPGLVRVAHRGVRGPLLRRPHARRGDQAGRGRTSPGWSPPTPWPARPAL